MKFRDCTLALNTRMYKLKAKDISDVKHEGGMVYSIGLVEFLAQGMPEAGDVIVYLPTIDLPRLIHKELFKEMTTCRRL